MSKEEALQNLVMIVGTFGVMLIPVSIGLLVSMWSKTRAAIDSNTLAVAKLESKVELMWGWSQDFPKLKKDVDAAHSKLRQMED